MCMYARISRMQVIWLQTNSYRVCLCSYTKDGIHCICEYMNYELIKINDTLYMVTEVQFIWLKLEYHINILYQKILTQIVHKTLALHWFFVQFQHLICWHFLCLATGIKYVHTHFVSIIEWNHCLLPFPIWWARRSSVHSAKKSDTFVFHWYWTNIAVTFG